METNKQIERPWIDDRKRFEFFAADIFGLDVTALGSSYIYQATSDAHDAWTELREKELFPVFPAEAETLAELARLRIESLRLKQRHDELLEIHTILMAPGDCPSPSDTDTMTVKMLKDIIHDRARMRHLMLAANKEKEHD